MTLVHTDAPLQAGSVLAPAPVTAVGVAERKARVDELVAELGVVAKRDVAEVWDHIAFWACSGAGATKDTEVMK